MKQVRRKSLDPVLPALVQAARKAGSSLIWERYEKQLPQDGFGRLGLTCYDCLQGPCRLHPFGEEPQVTICGRSNDDLVSTWLENKVTLANVARRSLAWELLTYAQARGITSDDLNTIRDIVCSQDIPGPVNDSVGRSLARAGQAMALDEAIVTLADFLWPTADNQRLKWGTGHLNSEGINIGLYCCSPLLVAALREKCQTLGEKISLLLIGGDNFFRHMGLPVVPSSRQEAVLLSGLIDILLVSDKAFSSGLARMAKEINISVLVTPAICNEKDIDTTWQQLLQLIERRPACNVNPQLTNQAKEIMFPKIEDIVADLADGLKSNRYRGFCFFGGSSNVKHTNDEVLVALTKAFLTSDVVCLAAGDGLLNLCKYDEGEHIIPLGSLYDMSCGWKIVEQVANKLGNSPQELPVIVIYPEMTTVIELSQAMGWAHRGITTYIGTPLPVWGSRETVARLQEEGLLLVSKPVSAEETRSSLEQILKTKGTRKGASL